MFSPFFIPLFPLKVFKPYVIGKVHVIFSFFAIRQLSSCSALFPVFKPPPPIFSDPLYPLESPPLSFVVQSPLCRPLIFFFFAPFFLFCLIFVQNVLDLQFWRSCSFLLRKICLSADGRSSLFFLFPFKFLKLRSPNTALFTIPFSPRVVFFFFDILPPYLVMSPGICFFRHLYSLINFTFFRLLCLFLFERPHSTVLMIYPRHPLALAIMRGTSKTYHAFSFPPPLLTFSFAFRTFPSVCATVSMCPITPFFPPLS